MRHWQNSRCIRWSNHEILKGATDKKVLNTANIVFGRSANILTITEISWMELIVSFHSTKRRTGPFMPGSIMAHHLLQHLATFILLLYLSSPVLTCIRISSFGTWSADFPPSLLHSIYPVMDVCWGVIGSEYEIGDSRSDSIWVS